MGGEGKLFMERINDLGQKEESVQLGEPQEMEINRAEKDSIMFYQGGGRNVRLPSREQALRDFYNADNAYMVINTLLMPGIENEKARMINEEKKFDLILLEHMDELIKIYRRLYSAMCKYAMSHKDKSRHYTYRIDRMNSLHFLQFGQLFSYMSTTQYKEKNTYFCDKDGLLLLEISAPVEIEHIDINAVLGGESMFFHENEILYAPFIHLDMEALEMTEEEKTYRDRNQNPPMAKYRLHLRSSSITARQIDFESPDVTKLYEELLNPLAIEDIRHVWSSYMGGIEPKQDIVKRYVAWKRNFRAYIKLCCAGIKWNLLFTKNGMPSPSF